MAKNKTQPTTMSVTEYVAAIEDAERKADAKTLIKLMQEASGEKAKLWGPSIIGFGSHHYKYESGREGETPLVSFSPRKSALVVYGVNAGEGSAAKLAKLGKHKTDGGCIYIKKLADVDEKVLKSLIAGAVAARGGKG
jgi:Domain of unknown function (DU1801)